MKGMDYRKTVQLPQTEFPMKGAPCRSGARTAQIWEERRLLPKPSRDGEGRGAGDFSSSTTVLPMPTDTFTSARALNKMFKDMVVRSKSMDGYRAPYVPGWDTHGLPIESRWCES